MRAVVSQLTQIVRYRVLSSVFNAAFKSQYGSSNSSSSSSSAPAPFRIGEHLKGVREKLAISTPQQIEAFFTRPWYAFFL